MARARREPRYKPIPKDAWNQFYTVGRIFQIAVPNPKKRRYSIRGPQPSVTFRRNVVVEAGPESSTCLTIKTYENEATTRPDKRSKQNEHAVIYTSRDPPKPLPGESELRRPVGARADSQDARLPLLARLNYGEKFVVQHTEAVHCLGRVLEEHIEHFFEDYQKVQSLWTESQETSLNPPATIAIPEVELSGLDKGVPEVDGQVGSTVAPEAAENPLDYLVLEDPDPSASVSPKLEPEESCPDTLPSENQDPEDTHFRNPSQDDHDIEGSAKKSPQASELDISRIPESFGLAADSEELAITPTFQSTTFPESTVGDDSEKSVSDEEISEHDTADEENPDQAPPDTDELVDDKTEQEGSFTGVQASVHPNPAIKEDQDVPEDTSNYGTPEYELSEDDCHVRFMSDKTAPEQNGPQRGEPESPNQGQVATKQDSLVEDQPVPLTELVFSAGIDDATETVEPSDNPTTPPLFPFFGFNKGKEKDAVLEEMECLSPSSLPQNATETSQELEGSKSAQPEHATGQEDYCQAERDPRCASCEEIPDGLPENIEPEPPVVTGVQPFLPLSPTQSHRSMVVVDSEGSSVPIETIIEAIAKHQYVAFPEEPPSSGPFFRVISGGNCPQRSFSSMQPERQDSFEIESPGNSSQLPASTRASEQSTPIDSLDPPRDPVQKNEPVQASEPEEASNLPKIEITNDFLGPSIGSFPSEPEPEVREHPSQRAVSPTPLEDVASRPKDDVESITSDAEDEPNLESSSSSDPEPSIDSPSPAPSPGPASSQTSTETRASNDKSRRFHSKSSRIEQRSRDEKTSRPTCTDVPNLQDQQNHFFPGQQQQQSYFDSSLSNHFNSNTAYQTYQGPYVPQPQPAQHHTQAYAPFIPTQPSYHAPEFPGPVRPYPINTQSTISYNSNPNHAYQHPQTTWPTIPMSNVPYTHQQFLAQPHSHNQPYVLPSTSGPSQSTGNFSHDNGQYEHDLIFYNDQHTGTFLLRALLDTGAALNFISAAKAHSIGLNFLPYWGQHVLLGDGRVTQPQHMVSGRWRFGPSGKTTWTDSFVVLPNMERDVIIGREVIHQRSYLLPNKELLVLGLPKLSKEERAALERGQRLKEEQDILKEKEERHKMREKENERRKAKGKGKRKKHDETTGSGEEVWQSASERQ